MKTNRIVKKAVTCIAFISIETLVILAFTAEVWGADLIVDGSFEDVSSTFTGNGENSELGNHNYYGSAWGGDDVLNQWTKVSSGRSWVVTDGADEEFPDGTSAIRLDGQDNYAARIYQTNIALRVGAVYTLMVDHWHSGGMSAQLVGESSSTTTAVFNAVSDPFPTNGLYITQTNEFTVSTTESFTLELWEAAGGANGDHHWIDNVRLIGPPGGTVISIK